MRYYLAFWGNEGFESIQDITKFEKWDQTQLMMILSEKQHGSEPNPLDVMINHMRMRARFNPQRECEIYAFMSKDDIDLDALNEWEERDAQGLVDWIRDNGLKLHSDKGIATRRVIS
jgi:hypothetical protein